MAPWRPESVQSGKADAPALSARRGVKDALSATLSAPYSSRPYLCGRFPQKKPLGGPKACKTESGRARSFRPQGQKEGTVRDLLQTANIVNAKIELFFCHFVNFSFGMNNAVPIFTKFLKIGDKYFCASFHITPSVVFFVRTVL